MFFPLTLYTELSHCCFVSTAQEKCLHLKAFSCCVCVYTEVHACATEDCIWSVRGILWSRVFEELSVQRHVQDCKLFDWSCKKKKMANTRPRSRSHRRLQCQSPSYCCVRNETEWFLHIWVRGETWWHFRKGNTSLDEWCMHCIYLHLWNAS